MLSRAWLDPAFIGLQKTNIIKSLSQSFQLVDTLLTGRFVQTQLISPVDQLGQIFHLFFPSLTESSWRSSLGRHPKQMASIHVTFRFNCLNVSFSVIISKSIQSGYLETQNVFGFLPLYEDGTHVWQPP